jgi:hypothetical protein
MQIFALGIGAVTPQLRRQEQRGVIAESPTAPDKHKKKPLLAEANDYYLKKDRNNLSTKLSSTKKYHPEASETKKIESLFEKLEKEEQDRLAKAEAERMGAVNKLKKKIDDISGITWYEQPYFTHYNNRNLLSLYIGENSSGAWLRLKMSYTGDDWIFFTDAYLSYDGNTVSIPFNEYEEKKTDNHTDVWEWIDVSVSNSLLSYLREYANAKEPKMRLSGKYTRTLGTNEIKGLKDILLAYDVLMKTK